MYVSRKEHIQEPVLVGLNHRFPGLAGHPDIGEHLLVGGIHVEYVVWRVLKIAGNLTGRWKQRSMS